MATIRRSGSGWQALIRKKEYVGPKAKTFSSKAQAQLWANAVEGSLKRPEQLDQPTTTYRVSSSNSSSSACRSSRATGGLLGGGLAAAVSKKDAWGWAIPLGAVVGLGVGDANC